MFNLYVCLDICQVHSALFGNLEVFMKMVLYPIFLVFFN